MLGSSLHGSDVNSSACSLYEVWGQGDRVPHSRPQISCTVTSIEVVKHLFSFSTKSNVLAPRFGCERLEHDSVMTHVPVSPLLSSPSSAALKWPQVSVPYTLGVFL